LVLKEVIVDFELGGSGNRVDLIEGSALRVIRNDRDSVTGECVAKVIKDEPKYIFLCSDTLANLLTRTSGLLPFPEGLFGTLGVGAQGERGELRYVCCFFYTTLLKRV